MEMSAGVLQERFDMLAIKAKSTLIVPHVSPSPIIGFRIVGHDVIVLHGQPQWLVLQNVGRRGRQI